MSPWRELEEILERMPMRWRGERMETVMMPAVDMMEKDDKYIVRAELPGMSKDDLEVSFTGNNLVIKGERKAEREVREEDYYLSERSYGTFHRVITMPSPVDTGKVDAKYENGVLEISVPKAEKEKAQKIQIQTKE